MAVLPKSESVFQLPPPIDFRGLQQQPPTLGLNQWMSKGIFGFLLLISSLSAIAQDTTSTPQYDLKVGISARHIGGNFQQFVYANQLDFSFTLHHWEVHNLSSYRFNQTLGQTIENNWYQLIQVSFLPKGKKLFPTAFYHFDNNLMFRVIHRHLTGAGMSSSQTWQGQYARMDLGLGYDYTHYDDLGALFVNSDRQGAVRNRPIFILRLIHEHKLFKEKVLLSNDLFYRHSLIEKSDYFLILRPTIAAKLHKTLSVNLSYEYRLENVHLSDLSLFNTTLLAGLTFQVNS